MQVHFEEKITTQNSKHKKRIRTKEIDKTTKWINLTMKTF